MIEQLLIFYIILLRIFELRLSSKNTKILLSKGAVEQYSSHYIYFIIFHVVFIVYFFIKSFSYIETTYIFYFLFFLTQIIRYLVIKELGGLWTTRIIVCNNTPLVKTGIYRYFRHPNYMVVALEIIIICLIFIDYYALAFFTFLKIILLSIRIYFEDKANKKRRII